MLGPALAGRLELGGVLHHRDDLVDTGTAGTGRHLNLDVAILQGGSRVDREALPLVHGTGLARHRGLVKLARAGNDHAVHRQDLTGVHVQDDALAHIGKGDPHILPVDDLPDRFCALDHALREGETGTALDMILEDVGNLQQEEHGTRIAEGATQQRCRDRRGVEHLDGELARKKVPHA